MQKGYYVKNRSTDTETGVWKSAAPFLTITFGLTWGLGFIAFAFPDAVERLFGTFTNTNPLFILAVYSPALSAVVLILARCGVNGLKGFAARFSKFKAHPGWWVLIIAVPPIVMFLGSLSNGNYDIFENFSFNGTTIASILFMLVLGPIEELGWRGYLLPLLNRKYIPIVSSLIIGVIWMVWHLPAFLIGGTQQSAWSFLPFMFGGISISILMTIIFNKSEGSLVLPFIFHFQLNNPLWPDAQPWDNVIISIVTFAIVVIYRKDFFTRNGSYTEITG